MTLENGVENTFVEMNAGEMRAVQPVLPKHTTRPFAGVFKSQFLRDLVNFGDKFS